MMPTASSSLLLVRREFHDRSNSIPTAMSDHLLRTSRISRIQPELAPETHPLTIESEPKALSEAQAKPAAPLFPRIKASPVAEPIKVVSALISRSPEPILNEPKPSVTDMVPGFRGVELPTKLCYIHDFRAVSGDLDDPGPAGHYP